MAFLFTSEAVAPGHPDKLADAISDAVLDAYLAQDPRARVACETYVTNGLCLVGGEVRSTANVDAAQVARADSRCTLPFENEPARRIGRRSQRSGW